MFVVDYDIVKLSLSTLAQCELKDVNNKSTVLIVIMKLANFPK